MITDHKSLVAIPKQRWQSSHKDYTGSCCEYPKIGKESYISQVHNSAKLTDYQGKTILKVKMKKSQI